MTTTGTWYPPPRHYAPAAGSGGFLINPPFAIMNNEHPITPPPELIRQWDGEASRAEMPWQIHLATQAARWGADQELEACLDHIRNYQWGFVDRPDGTKMHRALDLKLARRPKPPSLKEQALADFGHLMGELIGTERHAECIDTIRRALEALPE